MTVHQTSFDRRTFLKASGVLAVGFSLSGTAAANTAPSMSINPSRVPPTQNPRVLA